MNPGERRCLLQDRPQETRHGVGLAFHFRHQSRRGIEHISAEPKLTGEFVHKRPEPHALHNAPQPNSYAPARGRGGKGHLIRF